MRGGDQPGLILQRAGAQREGQGGKERHVPPAISLPQLKNKSAAARGVNLFQIEIGHDASLSAHLAHSCCLPSAPIRRHSACCTALAQAALDSPVPWPAADYNFDAPGAVDEVLLLECLDTLRIGKPFDVPLYDFSTHARDASSTRRVEPAQVHAPAAFSHVACFACSCAGLGVAACLRVCSQ